jgi:hypothetical protein
VPKEWQQHTIAEHELNDCLSCLCTVVSDTRSTVRGSLADAELVPMRCSHVGGSAEGKATCVELRTGL